MSTRHAVKVWRAPLAIGVISAFGLMVALLADGVGDVLGWSALSLPVVVVTWCALPGNQSKLRGASANAPAQGGTAT